MVESTPLLSTSTWLRIGIRNANGITTTPASLRDNGEASNSKYSFQAQFPATSSQTDSLSCDPGPQQP